MLQRREGGVWTTFDQGGGTYPAQVLRVQLPRKGLQRLWALKKVRGFQEGEVWAAEGGGGIERRRRMKRSAVFWQRQ